MSIALSYDEMRGLLKKRLKKSRYEHSLGVAETAVKLARRFGVNEEKAKIAGLLHDCAREYERDEMIVEAGKRGIVYGETEQRVPLLLHASIGAERIAECYGVEDEEIAQAIRFHTVGGANMTALDKIIYFADMIEPRRDYPEVGELRYYAENMTLDEMMLKGLDESIKFVIEKGALIHPATITARNELLIAACDAAPELT